MRLAAALVCAALPGFAPAQDDVFRAEARLVVLHATVTDKNGHLLTTLPRTAFRTFEDGVEQQLKVFRREDVPVSLGLIIDNSASMKERRGKVEAAAMSLVRESNPEDEVFVVNFNDDVFRDVDLTGDSSKVMTGLSRIDSRGGTALYDALQASLKYVKQKGRHDKKVLVVVSDGEDNMSGATLDEVIADAQRREVLVYTIGLLSDQPGAEARRARKALQDIARATGGEVFFPDSADQVGMIALQVARDIRSQYILAYTPINAKMDGGFRKIRVTATGPRSPVVRTRTGYYATPATPKRR